ncbi:demethylmenaquinone methyltransferase / 2-methoxy-6-polyprenyl-1,4-benzoquinol methylase [Neorhodopirellula lusitana]|uniref:Demethylmenaquinone methyltransferase n=1 Tax=Neorhodopirellula lusitana TaxID=445327 RepID=A0ABY1PRY3_9BACT|nr:bifunctional demethylmenaquinone methyltransferase/2-methoxy-6-polyprenyl-1,4-benzoquinol methylase UbiE [Neorhodopirellula lusitana]SMP44309.1 demethylmenaquinone methyltransferase / 2-methoxy-6-polyprenyl-1,4-benzoquinol methylase [Neorhodopirellula lusitana]
MSFPEPSQSAQPASATVGAEGPNCTTDGGDTQDHANSNGASKLDKNKQDKPKLDKSAKRVQEMFRQIAPRYDTMNHVLSLNIDKWWRRKAVQKLKIQGDAPILDLCCGTGDLAIAIADFAETDVQVIGSDFCHAMLEIARDKEADRTRNARGGIGRKTIPFFEADSMALPFATDHFQCVTVAFGLRNIADTDVGLSEMFRVCQPGGQVMVLEFSQPTLPILKQLYGFYFRSVLPKVGQLMARNDKSAYEYLPASVGQFPCGEELAQRMRDVGMTNVTFTPLTLGVATIYIGQKPTPPAEPKVQKTTPNQADTSPVVATA